MVPEWVNYYDGCSILLHNIGPGNRVIKVVLTTVALQYILTIHSDERKKHNKNNLSLNKTTNHYNCHDFGLNKTFIMTLLSSTDVIEQ